MIKSTKDVVTGVIFKDRSLSKTAAANLLGIDSKLSLVGLINGAVFQIIGAKRAEAEEAAAKHFRHRSAHFGSDIQANMMEVGVVSPSDALRRTATPDVIER